MKPVSRNVPHLIKDHWQHLLGGTLLLLWCLPYVTTGARVAPGDFSFFAQAYEAMRQTILHYHQFPWWNPWMAGGVPLYANPQMGVFSPQLILVLIFGSPIGLKLSLVMYTVAGYISMYVLLHKYFKVQAYISTSLSLLWVFCTFFVSHLPSHYTFAWYMLTPLFVYFALTVNGWRGGLKFGLAFAIMALSQIHNPFFHISFICGIILGFRLVFEKVNRKQLIICMAVAGSVFLLLAGHRLYYTAQNVHDFSRYGQGDPTASAYTDILGPIAPFSVAHNLRFINVPQKPEAPYGYGEVTATIGVAAIFLAFICFTYLIYSIKAGGKDRELGFYGTPVIILCITLLCYILGVGKFSRFAPYNVLKHLPIMGEMRVSTRWFIFFDLGVLLFIGVVVQRAKARSFMGVLGKVLLSVGVVELFLLNVGYQSKDLLIQPKIPPKPSYAYPFVQTKMFESTDKLADGSTVQASDTAPAYEREYEATLFNEGVIYANDSLIQLANSTSYRYGHPTCGWEDGCNLVKTGNAVVTYWSPNKITLKRTSQGPISLNMNGSNYMVIDGQQQKGRVVEPYRDFIISKPSQELTIRFNP